MGLGKDIVYCINGKNIKCTLWMPFDFCNEKVIRKHNTGITVMCDGCAYHASYDSSDNVVETCRDLLMALSQLLSSPESYELFCEVKKRREEEDERERRRAAEKGGLMKGGK